MTATSVEATRSWSTTRRQRRHVGARPRRATPDRSVRHPRRAPPGRGGPTRRRARRANAAMASPPSSEAPPPSSSTGASGSALRDGHAGLVERVDHVGRRRAGVVAPPATTGAGRRPSRGRRRSDRAGDQARGGSRPRCGTGRSAKVPPHEFRPLSLTELSSSRRPLGAALGERLASEADVLPCGEEAEHDPGDRRAPRQHLPERAPGYRTTTARWRTGTTGTRTCWRTCRPCPTR